MAQGAVMRPALWLFAGLQAADAATTIIGIRWFGASEMSPFVRWLLGLGPMGGMLACKLLGVALAAVAIASHRPRVIARVNWFFAGIVAWNVIQIAKVLA